MTGRGKTGRPTRGWRKILLGIGCTGVAAAGVCLARGPLARVFAAPPPQAAPTTPAQPTAPATGRAYDYSATYVATFEDGKYGITREELGEYLIARHGEKVEHLINKRIIED